VIKNFAAEINRKIRETINYERRRIEYSERVLLNQGRILSNQQVNKPATRQVDIQEEEFSIFSQFGEDGIIQYLTSFVEIKHKTFIEFGVEDFTESNCRFLMMKDNWRGFVIDGSERNISRLVKSYFYWKHDIQAICAFVDKDNIEVLLELSGFDHDLGILSIDLDGIDYFVLSSIKKYKPRILICEFNPIFGPKRKVTVPYDKKFQRFEHHHSGLYWGASLSAINDVAIGLGYRLVGTNSAGHNAFFVREDLILPPLKRLDPEEAFTVPTYRDGRDEQGNLSFDNFSKRETLIRGLRVLNTETQLIEQL
jgi:hypothetical protein